MAYRTYDRTLPDGSSQAVLEVTASARQNLDALIDALVMGGTYEGVSMTVTGDPEQPDSVVYARGAGRIWLGIMWNEDGNPESISYYSSKDSGGTWDLIGNKVVTWDSGGNVTRTDWDYEAPSEGVAFLVDFSQATLVPRIQRPTPE